MMKTSVAHSSVVRASAALLVLSLLALAAPLLSPGEAAARAAHGVPLDHFRCYSVVVPPPFPAAPPLVLLEDQFDVRRQIEEEVWVLEAEHFCNPVAKRIENPRTGAVDGAPIEDPDNHLTLYRIRDSIIHRPVTWNVVVRNQFGTQKLVAKRPRFLAVPTLKVHPPAPVPPPVHEFPEDLDHFKCYDAVGKEIALKANLSDQFEVADVVVLDPKLFCNPTRKLHGAVSAGIDHPFEHLTCYDLIEVPSGPFSFVQVLPRGISNQFTGTPIAPIQVATDEDLLCVPSRKLSFTAVGGGGADDFTSGRGED